MNTEAKHFGLKAFSCTYTTSTEMIRLEIMGKNSIIFNLIISVLVVYVQL